MYETKSFACVDKHGYVWIYSPIHFFLFACFNGSQNELQFAHIKEFQDIVVVILKSFQKKTFSIVSKIYTNVVRSVV